MSIVFIKQHDSMQCDVACLQIICEYYHKKY
ncbi:cysteine peptidase family C39 domain-containing protein [Prevotella sp.]